MANNPHGKWRSMSAYDCYLCNIDEQERPSNLVMVRSGGEYLIEVRGIIEANIPVTARKVYLHFSDGTVVRCMRRGNQWLFDCVRAPDGEPSAIITLLARFEWVCPSLHLYCPTEFEIRRVINEWMDTFDSGTIGRICSLLRYWEARNSTDLVV